MIQQNSVRVERSRDTIKARTVDGPLDYARGERSCGSTASYPDDGYSMACHAGQRQT